MHMKRTIYEGCKMFFLLDMVLNLGFQIRSSGCIAHKSQSSLLKPSCLLHLLRWHWRASGTSPILKTYSRTRRQGNLGENSDINGYRYKQHRGKKMNKIGHEYKLDAVYLGYEWEIHANVMFGPMSTGEYEDPKFQCGTCFVVFFVLLFQFCSLRFKFLNDFFIAATTVMSSYHVWIN